MLKNYLKSAKRNILKNKGVYGINILGLSLGLASCLLILLFILDELSYDKFHENANDIVRVVFKAEIGGEEISEAVVMPPVGPTLEKEFPEVLRAVRLRKMNDPKLTYYNKIYRDFEFAYIDPEFLEVFDLKIIEGDSTNPLENRNAVIITQKQAERYFGTENPIGKQLEFKQWDKQFTVTAVIEEMPKNSHFEFEVFASMEGYEYANSTSWVNSDFHTYLLLKDGEQYQELEAKLPGIIDKYMGPQILEAIGVSYSEFRDKNRAGLFLQPLADIHLNPNFVSSGDLKPGMDIKYLYIFGAVAIFMLVIACINFMNLATASASKRSKEVGIRKVLGSNKNQLIYQFLAEAFISTIFATALAIALFAWSLPFFNVLAGKTIEFSTILNPLYLLSLLGLIFLVTILAGAYPAFYLSSFNPLNALKSKFPGNGKSSGMRSGLVVFQFVISAGLILATLVVSEQMNYIQNKDVGYEKDQLLVIKDTYLLEKNEDNFIQEIKNDPRVDRVTHSAFVPAGESDNEVGGTFQNGEFLRRMYFYNVDENYIPTMGMDLLQGRNFSEEFGDESDKVIINEKAAEILGFEKDAVGKTFQRDTNEGLKDITVIGVIKNFNWKSLHQEIEPLILTKNPYGGIILRSKIADMSGIIEPLDTRWNQYNPREALNYSVLDESFKHTYLRERKMGTILTIFAFLTIIVACLGLFGLVTFTAEQRFKEIGIRKVLGSSATQIVALLSKDFLKLVAISFLIAFPLSFYLMNRWLQDFAYRINIQWYLFVMAAVITLGIAFLTIAIKSFKAASANPIKSLKTE